MFISQNFRRPFLVISSIFYVSALPNCTNQLFASFILKISRFSAFFSTLFHYSSLKFTTTAAQFPFYNCKLHFITAQIVISCTLKCALYIIYYLLLLWIYYYVSYICIYYIIYYYFGSNIDVA